MTLNDFLQLIREEDARIELGIAKEDKYESFWLSDYREGNINAVKYEDRKVQSIGFCTDYDDNAELSIYID